MTGLKNIQLEGKRLERLTPRFLIYKYSILSLCFIAICLFLLSLPTLFHSIQTNCIEKTCNEVGAVPPGRAQLEAIGWSNTTYAAFYTGMYSLFALVFIGAAFLIFIKKPNNRMSLFSILTLCTFGVTFPATTSVLEGNHVLMDFFINLIYVASVISIVMFFFLFPNGKFVPKWSGWIVAFLVMSRCIEFIIPSLGWSLNDNILTIALWLVVWLTAQLISQIYRFRKISSPAEQQQTKWVVYGFGVVTIGFLSIGVIPVFIDERYITEGGPIKFAFMNLGIHSVFMLLPITITIAILRNRLWDIDLILKRTFIYGVLSLFIVAVYILVVWYLGLFFWQQGSLLFSLIATAIVAVSFGPIKEKLQKTANRYLFGEIESPYKALEQLVKHYEQTMESNEAMKMVAQTIKDSMRLPFVSITVHHQNGEFFTIETGVDQDEKLTYPVIHKGEELAVLVISPRYPQETFSKADQNLLQLLIRQAVVIIKSLKHDLEVRMLNESLQESRERLVIAREEERRRLRRNLHDDLAPRLAALALNAGTAEDLIKENPEKAVAMLSDVRNVIRKSVSDIRRLVHDLRPPALDELGIVGAIKERINDIKPKNIAHEHRIEFEFFPAELPILPAAVEVAAFRIVTEALVNVVKHSQGTKCQIIIYVNEQHETLELEIIDNGIGIPVSSVTLKNGIGLHSMKERAYELGGEWKIERLENGTRVCASLPITDY
ncbi:sensor histidine kinase [Bacillus sp. 03113]|uniref:sensor histidine kinase n=1 Tax=Bacillus sp. 03113 TaxID=2578211 RepID=UPI0015E898AA|nr:histidine kinase [Bacillus sp. 03113]